MGGGGLELENISLKQKIEGELQPEIDRLKNEKEVHIKKEKDLQEKYQKLENEQKDHIKKKKK